MGGGGIITGELARCGVPVGGGGIMTGELARCGVPVGGGGIITGLAMRKALVETNVAARKKGTHFNLTACH